MADVSCRSVNAGVAMGSLNSSFKLNVSASGGSGGSAMMSSSSDGTSVAAVFHFCATSVQRLSKAARRASSTWASCRALAASAEDLPVRIGGGRFPVGTEGPRWRFVHKVPVVVSPPDVSARWTPPFQ